MRLLIAILLTLICLPSIAQGHQSEAARVANEVDVELAWGDQWQEWREEMQLARSERIKAADRFAEVIGMLKRLFWCVFALCFLTLVAVILYLAKPVFQLMQGVFASRIWLMILALFIIGASITTLAAQTPASPVAPDGQAIGPQPAPKLPENSVVRPKLGVSYLQALKGHEKCQRPMVIIVSATWCVPCQKLKSELQGHIDAGVLDGCELTVVDWDISREIAMRLEGERPTFPTVIVFWKEGDQKKAVRYRGYINRQELRLLIARTK